MPYLFRRQGRFHFQMRVGAALESCSRISHVRCALRTGDRREASRRLITAMDWGYEFKEAPDLEDLGAALVRKLEPLVAAGPPTQLDTLKDRLVVEEMVGNFIKRSRERDFAFVGVAGLVALFKAFTEQNAAAEASAERRAWTERPQRPPERGSTRSLMLSEPGFDATPPDTSKAHVPAVAANDEFDASPTVSIPAPKEPAAVAPGADQIMTLLTRISARLERLEPTADVAKPSTATVEDIRLSEAVRRYLEAEEKRRASAKSEALVGPVARFLIDFLDDKQLGDITDEDIGRLDQALTEIPGIKGFSLEMRESLHKRYLHAQRSGWNGLKRASETTVDLRYRRPLRILFAWLKEQKLYAGPDFKFSASKDDLLAALPRDRFTDDEIVTFISAPPFTGCESRKAFWQPGRYFYQGDHYWIFLILLFCGMRTGEPPQIKLDDFLSFEAQSDDGQRETLWFIDMRPYDPAQGRKPIKALKHLKRGDFARVIPVHRVLIELGLLERVAKLRALGETRLFPGWEAHTSGTDEVRWGKEVSRAFDYGRKLTHVNLLRENISIYSLRHLLADLLDDGTVPQRLRNRVLGHRDKKSTANAADEYGSKGLPTAAQALMIINLDTPIIRRIREILLAAKRRAENGELAVLDPF